MNQFDQARAKFDKKREKQAIAPPKVELEKKEQPKQEKPKVAHMVVTVTGPANLSFEVDYAGTLLGSQINEKSLRELFRKLLSTMGRVRGDSR